MNWKDYFEEQNGDGYLATAGAGGAVNIAPYFRPTVLEDGTVAFGMSDGQTFKNVEENGHAVYAFNEGGYKGVRLYLEKVLVEDKGLILDQLRKRSDAEVLPGTGQHLKYLVAFKVTRHAPLTNV